MSTLTRTLGTTAVCLSLLSFGGIAFAQTTTTSSCYTFTSYLQKGSTGPEVVALQKALTLNGESVSATGTFGSDTVNAVKLFQSKYRISITGTVGPKTRNQLNTLFKCKATASSSTVTTSTTANLETSGATAIFTASNSGNTVSSGGTLTVPASSNSYSGAPIALSWSTQNLPTSPTQTYCFVKNSGGSTLIGGNGVQGSITYAPLQSTTVTLSCYQPPIDPTDAAAVNTLILSQSINIVVTASAQSIAFTIGGSQTNWIASTSPGTLTWNTTGYDSCNITSYYPTSTSATGVVSLSSPTSLSTERSSSTNVAPPTEPITFYQVQCFSSTAPIGTRRITVYKTLPTLTITSPNGGETWHVGAQQNIAFNWTGLPTGFRVEMRDANGTFLRYITDVNSHYSSAGGSINVTVPSSVVPGSYKVRLVDNWASGYGVTNIGDISDAPFTIAGAVLGASATADEVSSVPGCVPGYTFSVTTGEYCSPSTIPGCRPGDVFSSKTGQACSTTVNADSVRVLSPNGGETLVQGRPTPLSWKGGKGKVQIGLIEGNISNLSRFANSSAAVLGWIDVAALALNPAAPSYENWDGKKVCDLLMVTCWDVVPGKYRILAISEGLNGNYFIWDNVANTPGNVDMSDSPFTIAATSSNRTSVTVTSPNGGEVWKEVEHLTDTSSGNEDYVKHIKWSGVPDTQDVFGPNALVKAYLEKIQNKQYITVGRIPAVAKGSIQWVVGMVGNNDCDLYNCQLTSSNFSIVPPGQYYVRVVDIVTGTSDRSNKSFTIAGGNVLGASIAPQASEKACSVFAANLTRGASGAQVSALQRVLIKDGEAIDEVTGYFGLQTAAAVRAFQDKHASEILTPNGLSVGTGFVGAATRAKLNELFGCTS
jgi:peptidoglycan hydrolase-like protein with peptidoglycan-binding domain